MANNPVQENANAEVHVSIWQDRLTLMHQKLDHSPQILSLSVGRSSCCIFRVPQNLVYINGRGYQPDIVSIGPYHHGEPQLRMMEEHKWRLLNDLLKRTQSKGLTLEDYLRAVQPLEAEARECYSIKIEIPMDEFIEMLVLDGCFVIELFRKFGRVVAFEDDDPLSSLSWAYAFFLKDLIRLENQIPFFVLDCLFNLTQMPDEVELGCTLSNLTLKFFNDALWRSSDVNKFQHLQGEHLLDFLRTCFIPKSYQELNRSKFSSTRTIHCISKLRKAGIKLEALSDDSFLIVKFRHGVIGMPTIRVDDFMSVFLLNCVAYEQCRRDCPRHMTTYATLLNCLINSTKDVEYLCDKNIIENCLGTNAEITRFINKLGKEVHHDVFTGLFDEVNDYYYNISWKVVLWDIYLERYWYNYFNQPWSFISAVAAFALLILTATQTYYSVFTYFRQS